MVDINKHFITITPPSLKDNTGILDRLAKKIRKETGSWPLTPVKCIASFAKIIKTSNWQVTASLAQSPAGLVLVNVESGDTRNKAFNLSLVANRITKIPTNLWLQNGLGVALDIGSSYLQATLHDLVGGQKLAQGTCLNPQVEIGTDILTRIHIAASPGGLFRLQFMLINAIKTLVNNICLQADRSPSEIKGLVTASNTTMAHFFLGLNVQSLCREPYTPLINRPAPFFTADLGLIWAPKAVGYLMPNIGSYFGGDLVAGIIAVGLHQKSDLSILIDVGTNAEVVLGNKDWLLACAGAAGPALESGVAATGMLAQPGAIEGVIIDPSTRKLTLKIIPNLDGSISKAKGLCGSGLLQLLAQLYLNQIIDVRGKFIPDHPRIVPTNEGPGFMVANDIESDSYSPIIITEIEIDILLRSKAAMYSILRTATLSAGIEFNDLSFFYIAGAFGKVIDPETAITIGMLPDLPRCRFVTLGNSSLQGCQYLLLNPKSYSQIESIIERVTYLELNANQTLMNRFNAARFIPHTDYKRFPTVPTFYR